jgi:bile acid-coenzyme A ligase
MSIRGRYRLGDRYRLPVATMSISRCVTELAHRDPDRPAVVVDDVAITRAELDRRTNRLARAYADLGLRAGDMVTVALPNGVGFVEACVAAWKLGATPQPVSARLPAAELEAVVALADPALVVGAQVEGRQCLSAQWAPAPSYDDGLLPDAVSAEWKAPTSGGSTGRPKLIVATVPGLFDPDVPAVPYLRRDDVQLVPGPLYHNGPFLYAFRGLFCGHTVVLMRRFDAALALALVERHRVGFAMVVPTMMQRMWRLPERPRADVSSLHTLLHLGAPCPPWLKRAFLDWLGSDRVLELYAGTEGNGITLITGREWLERPGSVGRPALGSSVRVLDRETRAELPPGEVGEVFLLPATGPGTTYRYVGAEPTAVDGWETLGDLGCVDADGYLYLTDRSADLVVTGGSNVYPAEVEAALDSHPAVRSSCVIGLPDDDLGERVHALVDAPAGVDAAELLAHVGQRLVRYKVPRSVELVDGPLRDDAGKVRRSALRADRIVRPA